MLGGPLGISLAPYIKSSKTLTRWIQPMASWYANLSGYRRMGLKYDDLCQFLSPSFQFPRLIQYIVLEERSDVQRVCKFFDVTFQLNRGLKPRHLVVFLLENPTIVFTGLTEHLSAVFYIVTYRRTNGRSLNRSVVFTSPSRSCCDDSFRIPDISFHMSTRHTLKTLKEPNGTLCSFKSIRPFS